jgi:cbb3-type cytochrome oxidase subunit 3
MSEVAKFWLLLILLLCSIGMALWMNAGYAELLVTGD